MQIGSKKFTIIHMEEKRLSNTYASVLGDLDEAADVLRSAQSFYCYNLEEKIIDLTGPLQRKAKTIRALVPVNWKPYQKAGIIDENDYAFISVFQRAKSMEERERILNEYELEGYKTLLKVAQEVYSVEDIQKLLVFIDDMLWEDMTRILRFKEAAAEPWKPFLALLSHDDEFVRNLSSRILTKLLDTEKFQPATADIEFFLNWLKNGIKSENYYLLCVARCLQKLLRHDIYRFVFQNLNGLFRIIRILDSGIKPQAQYQFTFCIWVASYNAELAEKLHEYKTIEVLTELLKCCPAEIIKLPRIILATFRNLLEKPREEMIKRNNGLLMIQRKILKILDVVRARSKNFGDPELLEDFEAVEEELKRYIADLTTFDEYLLEVRSGQLEWSIVHTSKPFWDENAYRLNENNYEILKLLISLLEECKDSTVLCVAAHDLGEYMRRYLRGKTLVEEFGGKDILLKLIYHEDPEVKYHALKSLQILMLNHFELLVNFYGDVRIKDLLKKKNASQKSFS